MDKTITPAIRRIIDIAKYEIENAFCGEFATIEDVAKKQDELCIDMNERLKALKESGLFASSECDDVDGYIRCKLGKCYIDATYRTRQKLRDEYEF